VLVVDFMTFYWQTSYGNFMVSETNGIKVKVTVMGNRSAFTLRFPITGPTDHDQQHCYHHAPKVKPEAATVDVELLMMGVRTPETW